MQTKFQQGLLERLGGILEAHVEPIFKPEVKVTLIVRLPGNPEADILVSSDEDLDEVIALVERSKPRETIR
jgi:hypothetical protein